MYLLLLLVISCFAENLCNDPLDVMFVVDVSSTTDSDLKKYVIPFLTNVSDAMNVDNSVANIGVVDFSTKNGTAGLFCEGSQNPDTKNVISIGGDLGALISAIKTKITYRKGDSAIGHGLQSGLSGLKGHREDTFKYVVLLGSNEAECDNPGYKKQFSKDAFAANMTRTISSKYGFAVASVPISDKFPRNTCSSLSSEDALCIYPQKIDELATEQFVSSFVKSLCYSFTGKAKEGCDGTKHYVSIFGTGMRKNLGGELCRLVNKDQHTGNVTRITTSATYVGSELRCEVTKHEGVIEWEVEVSFNNGKVWLSTGAKVKITKDLCESNEPKKEHKYWAIIIPCAGVLFLCCVCCSCYCCLIILVCVVLTCGKIILLAGFTGFLGKKKKGETEPLISLIDEPEPQMVVNEEPPKEEPKKKEPLEPLEEPKMKKRYSSQYMVGGKAVPVHWGKEGLPSHRRQGTMGMGEGWGYNQIEKEYRASAKKEYEDKAKEFEERRKSRQMNQE